MDNILPILFAVFIVTYILVSLPMYLLGKRAGLKNPWFAFIPIANLYNMFLLAGIQPIWILAFIGVQFIPFIGAVLGIIFSIIICVSIARNFELGILGQVLAAAFGLFVWIYIIVSGKEFVGEVEDKYLA